MDIFEHLSMIPFLLIAMGFVRIVQGIGQSIHHQQRTEAAFKVSIPHGLLTVAVLLMMILFWWSSFDLNSGAEHEKNSWNFFEYGIYIMPCLIMYLLADLLFPRDFDNFEQISLHEHYLKQRREVFMLCTVNYLFFYAHSSMFYNMSSDSVQSLVYLFLCGITFPMVIWRNFILHLVLNALVILGLVYTATFNWTQFG